MSAATQRPYGGSYKRARKALLASKPPCHWCGEPATTADHEPPVSAVGHAHLNLVPACERCNKGRRGGPPATFSASPSRDW